MQAPPSPRSESIQGSEQDAGQTAHLTALIAAKEQILARKNSNKQQLARIDSLMGRLNSTRDSARLPSDSRQRDELLALHQHVQSVVKGFVQNLADIDFNEAEILLGGGTAEPGTVGQVATSGADDRRTFGVANQHIGTALDVTLDSMAAQAMQLSQAVARAPASAQHFVQPIVDEMQAMAQPRPLHIARLNGAARLHLDLRFTHVNLARLASVACSCSMRLIDALQLEALIAQQSGGGAAGDVMQPG